MKEIKSIKTEMNHLKKSIEFTENVLEEKVLKCQEKAEHLDERIREIYEWQLDPEYIHNKSVDLEDRSKHVLNLCHLFLFQLMKALLIMKTTLMLISTTMFLLLIHNILHLINFKETLSHSVILHLTTEYPKYKQNF